MEAKEAARKAVEDRKLAGKKTEDSDRNTSSSSPELKSPLHQSTPSSPPPAPQVEGGKFPVGGLVNGDSSAVRKTVNGNSREVKYSMNHINKALDKHTFPSPNIMFAG